MKAGLVSLPGDGKWVLLTNLIHSVNHRRQSDEIDVVAIGPPGVRLIEVKHWTDSHLRYVAEAADVLTMKTKRIASTLRNVIPSLPFVDGAILITQPPARARKLLDLDMVRGVRIRSLKHWSRALGANRASSISPAAVGALALKLKPRRLASINGARRRFGSYGNLELLTPPADTFRRVYRGIHSVTHDKVLLHIYDYSAVDVTHAQRTARREFDALRRLQLHRWAPRILDSFQDAHGHLGELSFFSLVDPSAPSVRQRAEDDAWTEEARLAFARSAIRALEELHSADQGGTPMVHRNLSPDSVLVLHNNSPVFTSFEHTKIASDVTLAIDPVATAEWVAPEVRKAGLHTATPKSDIHALCASLRLLFAKEYGGQRSKDAAWALASGCATDLDERTPLKDLKNQFDGLLGQEEPLKPIVGPARFWTDDQNVAFRGRSYRIVTRLGSGGVGTAFKVVEFAQDTEEEIGIFVGKVAHDQAAGEHARRCYEMVREATSRHLSLASVFEVATEWRDNEFLALASWIEGVPLADYAGVVPLLAEDSRMSAEELASRWLRDMCDALDTLHRSGLVHGDVSPRNMILSVPEQALVLIDYDCVARIGNPRTVPGTVLYAPPQRNQDEGAQRSDDLYSLAASFFHVLFDREPFARKGDQLRKGTLNWEDSDQEEYPGLVEFFESAVHPDPAMRPASAEEAVKKLPTANISRHPSFPREIPWLRKLLRSYPGSRWGNRETRGLDTEFASKTYVPTELEDILFQDIRARRVRLVVLCGNAGDGKTAMLQHLAEKLGMGRHNSSQRIVDEVVDGGLRIRMNLDGSAAWQGRSADDLLDEFLDPFRDGSPSEDIVHLLAINDGRLLEWLERSPRNTFIKSILRGFLEAVAGTTTPNGNGRADADHIAFRHLNQRSLVGTVLRSERRIATGFLDRLLDRLYGGDRALETWRPCLTCSARQRCQVFSATRVFGPQDLPEAEGPEIRERARERLFHALQAVHFRGETHITVRELRSALVYILFGTHYCSEYHEADSPVIDRPYWDRAFAAESPRRQGELMGELVQLDPALEAHPVIDRQLLREAPTAAGEGARARLASARRRAYFEWTKGRIAKEIGESGGEGQVLGLAQGRNIPRFRDLPLMDQEARSKVCETLCSGIARLGDLPQLALERKGVVPLRITPRTPTETAFWSEKPLEKFRLIVESGSSSVASAVGGDKISLHRQVWLVYTYESGEAVRLQVNAVLFHRLLRLADGFQLGDVSTDDVFANLSIFLHRLVQEDNRHLMAWNPMDDETIYSLRVEPSRSPGASRQELAITRVASKEVSQ